MVDRGILARRLTRRNLLRAGAVSGIGLVAGRLFTPPDAEALLCPCDVWNCGMISPGAFLNGGQSIAITCTVFGRGEMNLPFRLQVKQGQTKLAAQQDGGDIDVTTSGTLRTTVAPEGETWIPWSAVIDAPEGRTFEKTSVRVQCWLEPENAEHWTWTLDVPLLAIGDNDHFRATWMRTDHPVWDGAASRTWMWGPEAFTEALTEDYVESPGGTRTVQYYDKSRMEITNPDADPNSIWYVTNGLLVVELITGRLQRGNTAFDERQPAAINVAGDADDASGPTYATFGAVLDAATLDVGSVITQRIDRAANVSDDPALAAEYITVALVDDVTKHGIAAPFWDFMNSTGIIWDEGEHIEASLFADAYYATGRPITEAYWADVQVGGTEKLVLIQCFERRCLTYTPDNPDGWQVEAGNVGRHYYRWRYE